MKKLLLVRHQSLPDLGAARRRAGAVVAIVAGGIAGARWMKPDRDTSECVFGWLKTFCGHPSGAPKLLAFTPHKYIILGRCFLEPPGGGGGEFRPSGWDASAGGKTFLAVHHACEDIGSGW